MLLRDLTGTLAACILCTHKCELRCIPFDVTCISSFKCHRNTQVVTPAAGGPAENAGIRPQDAILAIGEKSTEGMSLFEAATLLQVR